MKKSYVSLILKSDIFIESVPFKNGKEIQWQKRILADYLTKKGSEVVNMLIAEYDYEMDIAVQREEAYADGKEEGERLGRIEGEKLGRNKGELLKLIKLTVKKLQKGYAAEQTAEMLENRWRQSR